MNRIQSRPNRALRAVLPLTITAASLAACSTLAELPTERIGSATMMLSNGLPAGTVQLLANGDKVTLAVAATGIAAGPRGFHLHTKGECTRPDFTSAGGHLNPQGRAHGKDAPGGAHVGDMPNLVFDSRQTASLSFDLPGTRAEVENWIFDADGTAVIIHAGEDDYRTDPTGNAGARAACGVLTRN
ncbi:superoxide dismutase family protein [Altererythrobacter sp. H2]|uniref:superoxide dismutase family protein n=1 Tax=Altererythrobacter sp. H2 TaxID=3108391 RepID=UPI000BCBD1AD|nr:superoxide dismutase family protein [Altererythrobacter sp. H2]OZA94497.1 MAG: superoxide dismutase [Erythrobacter sp. 34-65-8]WRK96325.1 superoxide dismutase family protein [Altererythrobacter sp. H2]